MVWLFLLRVVSMRSYTSVTIISNTSVSLFLQQQTSYRFNHFRLFILYLFFFYSQRPYSFHFEMKFLATFFLLSAKLQMFLQCFCLFCCYVKQNQTEKQKRAHDGGFINRLDCSAKEKRSHAIFETCNAVFMFSLSFQFNFS